MASQCYNSIQGLMMRGTRVNACGTPITGGTTDIVTSSGYVSIGLSAQYEEGTDYTQKNASGRLCVSDKGADQLTRYDLEIAFCQVDPELFELVGGVDLVLDYAGDSVGFAVDRDPGTGGFALEVWTKVPPSPDAACDPAGTGTYLYWLLPWVADGRVGDFTIEDGTATFSIKARTKYGNKWGRGPTTGYNVVATNSGGTPGRIASPGVATSQHLYQRVTTIAPPVASCGYQTAA